MIENIMEHIAHVTGVDPLDVRIANFRDENNLVKELVGDFRKKTGLSTGLNKILKEFMHIEVRKILFMLLLFSFLLYYRTFYYYNNHIIIYCIQLLIIYYSTNLTNFFINILIFRFF